MKRTRRKRIALALQFDDYSDNLLESRLYVYDYVYQSNSMPMYGYGSMTAMPMPMPMALWLSLWRLCLLSYAYGPMPMAVAMPIVYDACVDKNKGYKDGAYKGHKWLI